MIIGGGSGSGTIADGSIIEQKLSSGVQTKLNTVASGIADNAVVESKILNGAVTTYKISGNSIITDRIADNQITHQKLGLLAVKNINIFAETIQGGQGGKIAGSTITGWNIANNQIEDYHLHSSLLATLTGLSNSITNLQSTIDTLATPRGTIKIMNGSYDATNDSMGFTYVVTYVDVASQIGTQAFTGSVRPQASSTDFYRLPTFHQDTHIQINVITDTANGYVVMSSPDLIQGVASTIYVSGDYTKYIFAVNSAANYAHTNIIIRYIIDN